MRRYTVASLTAELVDLIRRRYPAILVEGEVTQITRPRSGHAYLELRDRADRGYATRGTTLSCVCWRDDWANLPVRPKEGDLVVCRGRLGVYPDRGTYQLYVTHIERAGKGAMADEIARRLARLQVDGLLDPARKRPLPAFPSVVGVATSLTGAALQDFLKVSLDRYPAARILVAPCTVQGDTAAATVLRAIDLLVEDARSDVIVVTRGGGSKEDLLPFQDERLARAVAASPIPVVSAVGHQVDTTILDLVADAVAPTPSAAALAVLPDGQALRQRVDEAEIALSSSVARMLAQRRDRLAAAQARLRHPRERLARVRARASELESRLTAAVARRHAEATRHLAAVEARLNALSPLAVLGRGYAIVTGAGGVVTHPDQAPEGTAIDVRVEGGRFGATVNPR